MLELGRTACLAWSAENEAEQQARITRDLRNSSIAWATPTASCTISSSTAAIALRLEETVLLASSFVISGPVAQRVVTRHVIGFVEEFC